MLHADIPTRSEFKSLAEVRSDACVSLFLPTTPHSQDSQAEAVGLGQLAKQAYLQLEAAGLDKQRLASLKEHIEDLMDDAVFWKHQSNSLVVLATPDGLQSFRLPSHLSQELQVSDRFHLKPLLRAITFPHAALVLAVSQHHVRLIELFADLPATEVPLMGLTQGAADALGRTTIKDRSPSGRLQGDEGQKVLLKQYARHIDMALRGTLAGRDTPLLLAGTEPFVSIVRSIIRYPALAKQGIAMSPDRATVQELAEAAQPLMQGLQAEALLEAQAQVTLRGAQGRASHDLGEVARAATLGAVELLLVDMDGLLPGRVDDTTGAVTLAKEDDASTYGVLDEIASRALLAGARVMAVRAVDLPPGVQVQATLRYPIEALGREALLV